jgi:dihydroxy-acid dehydratase
LEKAQDVSRRRSSSCPIEQNITPRKILTRNRSENAIALVMALGDLDECRTAPAGDCAHRRVPLKLDDFNRIGAKVPHVADLKAQRPRM